jgi:hypothetical protein
MGVWEEALKEAAAQRYAEVQSLQRQRAQLTEQARALSDFIDGMNRLGIRPRRQPFPGVERISGREPLPGVALTHKGRLGHRSKRGRHTKWLGIRHEEPGQGALRSDTTSNVLADKRAPAIPH